MEDFLQLGKHQYEFTRGSDIPRDGMFVEVTIKELGARRTLAEVFYSDATATFSVSCFEADIPLELMEHLFQRARRWLPPSKQ